MGNRRGFAVPVRMFVFLAGLFSIRKCRAIAQIKPVPLFCVFIVPRLPAGALVAVLLAAFLLARRGCY